MDALCECGHQEEDHLIEFGHSTGCFVKPCDCGRFKKASLVPAHRLEVLVTERVYTTIDKSGWGDGPWQDEPDKVQWKDEATGLPCLAKRHPRHGHWCGYVGVSEGHPAFEKGYDDVHDLFGPYDSDAYLSVHGGLTYADACEEGDEAASICHVPEPGEPDHVWWLGFDCAHSGDVSPAMEARDRQKYEETGDPFWLPIKYPWSDSYRTLDYVRAECASLARQLTELVTA